MGEGQIGRWGEKAIERILKGNGASEQRGIEETDKRQIYGTIERSQRAKRFIRLNT
jgi:hypothetical protein